MSKILRVKQPSTAPFHLTWLMNNICTNKCSYCPETLHNGKNHYYEWNHAEKFLGILFSKFPKIHCTVAGGEPTVSPFFKDIVKLFYDNGHTIGVTSNGARTVRYWEEISKFLNYTCFSYHPEFPDPLFLDKVRAASKNTPITVRIMMLPSKWDECEELYFKIAKEFTVEPVRILNWSGRDQSAHIYSEKQLNWFENNTRIAMPQPELKRIITHPEIGATFYFDDGSIEKNPNTVDYINRGLTNFNGYRCEVGLKSLFIDFQGDVYLGNCAITGQVGTIQDPDNIKWQSTPVICNKLICHCTTDVNINKRARR